jgi:hypothetical protein
MIARLAGLRDPVRDETRIVRTQRSNHPTVLGVLARLEFHSPPFRVALKPLSFGDSNDIHELAFSCELTDGEFFPDLIEGEPPAFVGLFPGNPELEKVWCLRWNPRDQVGLGLHNDPGFIPIGLQK